MAEEAYQRKRGKIKGRAQRQRRKLRQGMGAALSGSSYGAASRAAYQQYMKIRKSLKK